MLISGGSGFIGRSIIPLWLSDPSNEVVAIIRNSQAQDAILSAAAGCLESPSFINLHEKKIEIDDFDVNPPQVILHLATLYLKNPSPQAQDEMRVANITLGLKLAHIAKRVGAKFIFTSSYMEYEVIASTEVKSYVDMKRFFSTEVRSMPQLDFVENIIADTYGPGDGRGKIMNQMINSIVKEEELLLRNPDQLLSITHSQDVARGIIGSTKVSRKRLLCASRNLISLGDLYRYAIEVERETASNYPRFSKKYPETGKRWIGYPQLVGWKPEVDLHSGIRGLIIEASNIIKSDTN